MTHHTTYFKEINKDMTCVNLCRSYESDGIELLVGSMTLCAVLQQVFSCMCKLCLWGSVVVCVDQ